MKITIDEHVDAPYSSSNIHLIQFILDKKYSFGIGIIDEGNNIEKQLQSIKEACKNVVKFIEGVKINEKNS